MQICPLRAHNMMLLLLRLQTTAYEMMLEGTRRPLHMAAANFLEEQVRQRGGSQHISTAALFNSYFLDDDDEQQPTGTTKVSKPLTAVPETSSATDLADGEARVTDGNSTEPKSRRTSLRMPPVAEANSAEFLDSTTNVNETEGAAEEAGISLSDESIGRTTIMRIRSNDPTFVLGCGAYLW